jgi:hypothetical protein
MTRLNHAEHIRIALRQRASFIRSARYWRSCGKLDRTQNAVSWARYTNHELVRLMIEEDNAPFRGPEGYPRAAPGRPVRPIPGHWLRC